MKAAIYQNKRLTIANVAKPIATKSKVLVKVEAFALNRADILQMQGLYSNVDDNYIPGLEVSGIVVETGQEVCVLLTEGAFAEYVLVDKKQLVDKPQNYSFEQAAALLECLATCYLNIFIKASARAGQTILIHGGTSGIGSFAIQMCRLKGLTVIASSSEDTKLQHCIDLGAHKVINYNNNFQEALKDQVDIILDILGGAYTNKNIKCLKPKGYLALIAVMGGSTSEISLSSVLMKNITIAGSTLRFRSINEKRSIISKALAEFDQYINDGTLKPIIDSVFEFQDLRKAMDRLVQRNNIGKVVITFGDHTHNMKAYNLLNKKLEYNERESKICLMGEGFSK